MITHRNVQVSILITHRNVQVSILITHRNLQASFRCTGNSGVWDFLTVGLALGIIQETWHTKVHVDCNGNITRFFSFIDYT